MITKKISKQRDVTEVYLYWNDVLFFKKWIYKNGTTYSRLFHSETY